MASKEQKQTFKTALGKQQSGTEAVQNQTTAATQQSGQGAVDALTEYQQNIRAAVNPYAADFNRQQFQESLGQTRNMISGIANAPGYTQAEQGQLQYTPGEQQDIRRAAVSPIVAGYGAAKGAVAGHTARTGNAAGFNPTMGRLDQAQGIDTSNALAGVTKGIADVRRQGAQSSADARRADTMGATQLSAAVPGQYQNAQNAETNSLNAFQFPVTSQFQNYATNLQGQLAALGIDSSNLGLLNQQAMQPGFWEKLLMAGVSGGAQVASSAVAPHP